MKEFGKSAGLQKNAATAKLLEHLKGSNNPKRAKSFDMEDHLPLLFQACFAGAVFKQWHKKVKIWARFLVGIALIARSSDVTEYCPEFDDVEYPEDPMDYMTENIPKHLVLVFKDWKGHPEWHKLQIPKYWVWLIFNPKDLQFCPIYWLFQHWLLRAKNGDTLTTGPIIEHNSSDIYMQDLKELFKSACLGTCSGHSVHWSTAQWAR